MKVALAFPLLSTDGRTYYTTLKYPRHTDSNDICYSAVASQNTDRKQNDMPPQ